MKVLSLLTIIFIQNTCFSQSVGELIGHRQYNQKIRSILIDDQNFKVESYIGTLSKLMGTFQGFSRSNIYVNGKANGFTFYIYKNIAELLSNELASICEQNQSQKKFKMGKYFLHLNASKVLTSFCLLKSNELSQELITSLWKLYFIFDPSISSPILKKEYLAFQDFSKSVWKENISNKEKLLQLNFYLLMNPYFILQR